MADRAYDRDRLKHLIHYVIWAVAARPNFGATKLYKIAWFADARRFVLAGQSITGAPYVREKHGPMPRDAWAIRHELANEGLISQWKAGVFDYEAWKFQSLMPPAPSVFLPEERKEIDYWARHIADDHTATSISEESHDYGWEIARTGEPLPFVSILAKRAREPTAEEMQWARSEAARLGLA